MQDFLRNNRGINDGGDLPVDYMEAVYDRIVHNEIKMKVLILGPEMFEDPPAVARACQHKSRSCTA